MTADAKGATIRTATGLTLSAAYAEGAATLEGRSRGVVAVRPEAVRLWRGTTPADATALACAVNGRIENRIYLGDQTEFSIATAELGDVLARVAKDAGAPLDELLPGNDVTLGWGRDRALALADV